MKPYLITYNYGQQTHFAYADTVAEARAYAADLLTNNNILASDSLSIIQVSDEQIIFFKAGNLTPDSLFEQPRRMSHVFDRLKALIYGGMAPAPVMHRPISAQH
ncbi:hypothetical protein J2I47_23675 [Fibrella sp. HMF5335]|uniref:Uncharacterized protein n=1 Tax=Fibrella rubiginis TaxID=2817060 RepID=A0A939GMJ9_9BACT|nr:hypothetical protein [Fibrella rubiginis]MBO0939570.1 hypothetical protein [Fibrella rubiginis]